MRSPTTYFRSALSSKKSGLAWFDGELTNLLGFPLLLLYKRFYVILQPLQNTLLSYLYPLKLTYSDIQNESLHVHQPVCYFRGPLVRTSPEAPISH